MPQRPRVPDWLSELNRRLPQRTGAQFGSRPYRVPHDRFSVETEDGVTIEGVHLRRGHDTICIYCHGFMSSKNLKAVPGFVEGLAERVDAAAFDFRGHGESGGECTFTRLEVLDVDAVVKYMRAQGYRRIVAIGSSMGGATVIRYGALYDGADGIVTIGAFADSGNFRRLTTQASLDIAFTHPIGPHYTRFVRGTRLGQLDKNIEQPLALVSRIEEPTLFIHGDWDMLVHPDEAKALHDLAQPPKELVIVPRTGHDMPLLNSRTRDLIVDWIERAVPFRD
ncbi:MAG: alpha/beta hydrolase [Anaerolineae bacterium]